MLHVTQYLENPSPNNFPRDWGTVLNLRSEILLSSTKRNARSDDDGKFGFCGEWTLSGVLFHERYAASSYADRHRCVLPCGLFLPPPGTHDDGDLLEPVFCGIEPVPNR